MSDGMASTSLAARIFSTPWAAFNLNRKPDIPQISVDSLAEMYGLPDLHPALVDLFSEGFEGPSLHRIGGHRRVHTNTRLPFTDVMVWFSFRIQTRSMDDGLVTDPRRLNAMPPSGDWPLGRFDAALFVNDGSNPMASPGVGLDGMSTQ